MSTNRGKSYYSYLQFHWPTKIKCSAEFSHTRTRCGFGHEWQRLSRMLVNCNIVSRSYCYGVWYPVVAWANTYTRADASLSSAVGRSAPTNTRLSSSWNPNTFLRMLDKKTFKKPKSTSDVYLYFPDRMLSILPTVNLFSNMNLMTGKQKKRPFFYQTQYFKDDGKVIHLGQGISFFKNTGMVQIGNKKVNLNKFIITEYDKDKKLQVHSQKINFSGELILIYMKNYNRFLLVDKKIFNSAYIQLYVLENYDDTLYEPTILTPLVKIFKLKN